MVTLMSLTGFIFMSVLQKFYRSSQVLSRFRRSFAEVSSTRCRSFVEVLSKFLRSFVEVLSKLCRSVVEVVSKCRRSCVEVRRSFVKVLSKFLSFVEVYQSFVDWAGGPSPQAPPGAVWARSQAAPNRAKRSRAQPKPS